MPNPSPPASDRQIVQFSHVVSKLIMAREKISQAYPDGGTNIDRELAKAYEIMAEACAKWFASLSRKTAETAARGEYEKLAHAAQEKGNFMEALIHIPELTEAQTVQVIRTLGQIAIENKCSALKLAWAGGANEVGIHLVALPLGRSEPDENSTLILIED